MNSLAAKILMALAAIAVPALVVAGILGVTLIDMGGATTGIAVFHDGNLVHSSIVPIGASFWKVQPALQPPRH